MSEKDEKYAPMLEHLDELRTRLIRCVLALLLGMVICFAFFQEPLADIIMGPFRVLDGLQNNLVDRNMVYTTFAEGFLFYLKISLLGGCVLASPVIIWQIMRFVLPALYKNEKRVFFTMTFFGVVLFVGGVCFGYFLVLRPVMETLIRLAGEELTPMITASSYLSFVLGFLIPFGLVFEIPMVVYFLTMVGIINPSMLTKNRKYVLLVVLVLAAMLTPPDIVSQLCLAAPMMLLYEIGIQISRFVYKRKQKKEARKHQA